MNSCKVALNLSGGKWDKTHEQSRRVYDTSGLCPALHTCGGGNQEVKILERKVLTPIRTEYGKEIRKAYENGEVTESRHNMTELVPRNDGMSNTLTTVQKDNLVIETSEIYTGVSPDFQRGPLSGLSRTIKASTHDAGVILDDRIRKLTSLECFRLMGFDDEDFHKAQAALIKTFYKGKDRASRQLYKQAGNSIIVNTLEAIMSEML